MLKYARRLGKSKREFSLKLHVGFCELRVKDDGWVPGPLLIMWERGNRSAATVAEEYDPVDCVVPFNESLSMMATLFASSKTGALETKEYKISLVEEKKGKQHLLASAKLDVAAAVQGGAAREFEFPLTVKANKIVASAVQSLKLSWEELTVVGDVSASEDDCESSTASATASPARRRAASRRDALSSDGDDATRIETASEYIDAAVLDIPPALMPRAAPQATRLPTVREDAGEAADVDEEDSRGHSDEDAAETQSSKSDGPVAAAAAAAAAVEAASAATQRPKAAGAGAAGAAGPAGAAGAAAAATARGTSKKRASELSREDAEVASEAAALSASAAIERYRRKLRERVDHIVELEQRVAALEDSEAGLRVLAESARSEADTAHSAVLRMQGELCEATASLQARVETLQAENKALSELCDRPRGGGGGGAGAEQFAAVNELYRMAAAERDELREMFVGAMTRLGAAEFEREREGAAHRDAERRLAKLVKAQQALSQQATAMEVELATLRRRR